jgi:hypothetical protein
MMQSILNCLFSCSHHRTTFPITRGRRDAASAAESAARTYVVCLDCGKEFAYDWVEMRLGKQVPPPTPATEAQPMFR